MAYALTKIGQGLTLNFFQWWHGPLNFILHLLYRDNLELSTFRASMN